MPDSQDIGTRYKQAVINRMEEKGDRDALLDNEKVKAIRVRRMQNELMLAKARDDVIEKNIVEKQAAYLLVSLRQKLLSVPHTYARRFLGLTETAQAVKLLREMAVSVLNEIKDLPQQVTDLRWLESIEKDETKL